MQYSAGTWPRQAHAEIVLVPRHPLRGGGGGGTMAGVHRKAAAYAPLGAILALIVMAVYWVARPPEAVAHVGLVGCSFRAHQCAHARIHRTSIRMLTNDTMALDLRPSRSLTAAPPLTTWAAPARWVSDFRVTKTSRFASPGTRSPSLCSHPDTRPLAVHRSITVYGCTTTRGCRSLTLRGAIAAQVQVEVAFAGDNLCCTCP
jgi:hypothetical protein